ncbi:DUF2891 family protein [Cryobacterium psychrophilum]|uniref:DUF2891 family protein n=2 Tax=Cryobacterium psychrophilum TaxID=41988 RepID=A0A4Y8KQA8_9MICO|nr:DUF2891 family protein [Cryobacterium psychrophilum]
MAPRYADIVLDNLARPFPHSAHHTTRSAEDRPLPHEIHLAFFTSFDWHSCVHMHYLGVTLLEHGVSADRDAAIRAALAATLMPEKLLVEAEYLRSNPSWERPYGWAWLLRLATVCAESTDARIRAWGHALDPLVDVVADLVVAWTATAEWPVRRVLGPHEFADWFTAFLPGLAADSRILKPVRVTDESDGYFVHLHGLNLSRAGQIARILAALEGAGGWDAGIRSEGASTLRTALEPLLRAGLAAAVAPDFMSSHWLATFA